MAKENEVNFFKFLIPIAILLFSILIRRRKENKNPSCETKKDLNINKPPLIKKAVFKKDKAKENTNLLDIENKENLESKNKISITKKLLDKNNLKDAIILREILKTKHFD